MLGLHERHLPLCARPRLVVIALKTLADLSDDPLARKQRFVAAPVVSQSR